MLLGQTVGPHSCLQDEDGSSVVDKLFGVALNTKLKCEESGEESQVCKDDGPSMPYYTA